MMQSEVTWIREKGERLKERWLDPSLKVELHRVLDQHYVVWYRQEIMLQPFKVERISREEAVEME